MPTAPSSSGGTPPISEPTPVVTAVQCVGQSLVDPADNSVSFTVNFNESVTGVMPADFAVNGLGGTVTSVGGYGCTYTVEVSGIPDGSGTLGLNVLNTGSILDFFGTPLGGIAAMAVDQQFTISRQLYWDASSGNGPAGGSGTWGPDSVNWHVGGLDGPAQGWVDGSNAFFVGVPGTVELTNPVVVSSITALSGGYVFEGGSITLTPSSPIPLSISEGDAMLSPSALVPNSEGSTIDVATGSAVIDCAGFGEPGEDRQRHARARRWG